MKKNLTFCLCATLALAAASCSDGNDKPNVVSDTITIENETQPVGSAFCTYEPADQIEEGSHMILLFKEAHTTVPMLATGFYVGIAISDSYLGKEIDLTRKLVKNGEQSPLVSLVTANRMLDIDDELLEVYRNPNDEMPSDLTVKSGKLVVTREGEEFVIKLAVQFSDGYWFGADWSGVPQEVVFE